MVKSHRYAVIVETQSTPLVVGDQIIQESYPLRYVGGIVYETEEQAWESHKNVEGAKVIQVIPFDLQWDEEGEKFSNYMGDELIKEEEQ